MNYSDIWEASKVVGVVGGIALAYIKYGDGLIIRLKTACNERKKIKKEEKFHKNLIVIITKYRQLKSSGDAEIPTMSYDDYMNIYEELLKVMVPENYPYVNPEIINRFNELRWWMDKFISTRKGIELDPINDLQSDIDSLHEVCYEKTHLLMDKFVQQIEWSFNKPHN